MIFSLIHCKSSWFDTTYRHCFRSSAFLLHEMVTKEPTEEIYFHTSTRYCKNLVIIILRIVIFNLHIGIFSILNAVVNLSQYISYAVKGSQYYHTYTRNQWKKKSQLIFAISVTSFVKKDVANKYKQAKMNFKAPALPVAVLLSTLALAIKFQRRVPALLPQVKWHKAHHAKLIDLTQQKLFLIVIAAQTLG